MKFEYCCSIHKIPICGCYGKLAGHLSDKDKKLDKDLRDLGYDPIKVGKTGSVLQGILNEKMELQQRLSGCERVARELLDSLKDDESILPGRAYEAYQSAKAYFGEEK